MMASRSCEFHASTQSFANCRASASVIHAMLLLVENEIWSNSIFDLTSPPPCASNDVLSDRLSSKSLPVVLDVTFDSEALLCEPLFTPVPKSHSLHPGSRTGFRESRSAAAIGRTG